MKSRPYAAYSLADIRTLISTNKFDVHPDALKTARKAFGWGRTEIKKAFLSLQKKHFKKSTENWDDPSIYVDSYKARGIMGENVYTHFHIEEGRLIIRSFKEI